MKKLMMTTALAAVLALGAASSYAAGTSQNINLTTSVSTSCTTTGATTINSGISIESGNVVDTPFDVPLGTVTCNTASNVTLSSSGGAAQTSTPDADGFQNFIAYSASMASPAAVTLDANNTVAPATATSAVPSAGATTGAVSVTIDPVVNTEPLVSGEYSDTLTVTITPTS
jgi:hypothetical protein